MKSKRIGVLLSLLTIVTLASCNTNDNKVDDNKDIIGDRLEEAPNDILNLNGGSSLKEVASTDDVQTSKLFAQFGFKESESIYYLRFAVAFRGDVDAINFTRSIQAGDDVSTESYQVETVYTGITADDTVYYYDGSELSTDEIHKEEFYWACYSIQYNDISLVSDDINISVYFNDDEATAITRSVSLEDVISLSGDKLMQNRYYKIEAEDMSNRDDEGGIAVGKIGDSEAASNGHFVQSMSAGQAMEFDYNLQYSGEYAFRVAATRNNTQVKNAYTVSVDETEVGGITVDDHKSWNQRFREYYAGGIALDAGERKIKVTKNEDANVDYISLSSMLTLEPNSNNTYEVYALDYTNVELKLTIDNESKIVASVNGDVLPAFSKTSTGSYGVLNLKPGLNTIVLSSGTDEALTISSIQLVNLYSQGTYDGSDLSMDAEKGIYVGNTECKSQYSDGIAVKNFASFAAFSFDASAASPFIATMYHSIYNDNVSYEAYLNNQKIDSAFLFNMKNWDTVHLSNSVSTLLTNKGANTLLIRPTQENKFNIDRVVLSSLPAFSGNDTTIINVDKAHFFGKITTSDDIHHLENLQDKDNTVFYVDSSVEGDFNLTIKYAANNDTAEAFNLIVNDASPVKFDLVKTGGWTTYKDANMVKISLKKGINSISIDYVKGGYNLESITISPDAE